MSRPIVAILSPQLFPGWCSNPSLSLHLAIPLVASIYSLPAALIGSHDCLSVLILDHVLLDLAPSF